MLAALPWVVRLRAAAPSERSQSFRPHTYWENRHAALRGSLRAVGHIQLDDALNRRQYETKRSRIADAIRRHARAAGGSERRTLLDAGCGTGVLTSTYVEMGFDVTGVDFSPSAIGQAQERGLDARFIVSPLHSLELSSFDVITVIDVLLHIVDDDEWALTLRRLVDHLNDGGIMIIVDQHVDSATQCDIARRSAHCRPRSRADYESALAARGGVVVEREHFTLEHERTTKALYVVVRDASVA
jgi:2-polyprenyl-3-methyl-5-hydroxy-6-metoxy-1,4-benzoquinol methylase